MTAPPLVTHSTLVAGIAAHAPSRGITPGGNPACSCGWVGRPGMSHADHLADALAPLFRDPATLADDEALVERLTTEVGLGPISVRRTASTLRALAAALSEGTE